MVEKILEEGLIDLKARIIENHVRAGQVASGSTIDSMSVMVDILGPSYVGTLWGRKYFANLETGNKPWSNQPKRTPYWFHDIIDKWISDKGLNLNAWAVAYNVIRHGTRLHRSGGRSDIFSSEIPKTIDSIGRQMLEFYDMQITDMIKLNN